MKFSGLVGLCLLLWVAPCAAQEATGETGETGEVSEISEDFLDSFAIQAALEQGQSVSEVATRLMEAGHSPQLVAREILLLRPEAANEVAATMARRSPAEAPFVAAAISWMADAEPATVAVAVATAVPEMASEVASHVAAAFPGQTAAVARAVAETYPEQLTEIASTMGVAVPENAAAVIDGVGPLLESLPITVDFLVEMFAALPLPLAAFAGPEAGLVLTVEGMVEKRPAATGTGEGAADGAEATPGDPEIPEAGFVDAIMPAASVVAELPTLSVGGSVVPGEHLITDTDERVMLMLRDGTILTLFERGVLRFGEALDGSAQPQGSLEKGVLRLVGSGGKARSWRFDLGAGGLTMAGADVLLARGDGGVGVLLLGGTAIWESAGGRTITLEPGRYRGDAQGVLRRPASDANVYDWLRSLGLEALDLGDLAEQSVWAAVRLGDAMDRGDTPDQIQTP